MDIIHIIAIFITAFWGANMLSDLAILTRREFKRDYPWLFHHFMLAVGVTLLFV